MNPNPSTASGDWRHAWREHPQRVPLRRSATERVADFLQIHGLFDEETAREQASRCIQCPEPSCVAGCPLGMAIPDWLRLTAEGRFLEAATLLHDSAPLTDVCAEVCPSDRLCEGVCVLHGRAEPVSVGAIERFLQEYAVATGSVESPGAPPNGFRVAVVGSGPGGLACADVLSRRGYAVSVFDADMVPGGLLVNGIPAFRLDRSIIHRRIELLKKRGVTFRMAVTLGREMTLAQLRAGFDAVFLGMDARRARELQIPGAGLQGVMQALPFIIRMNTRVPLDLEGVDVQGARVAVLGGGDTAMDCLRTAVRCGAAEVHCLTRRDEGSLRCSHEEYQAAVEEGARFWFQTSALEILGTDGRARGLRLEKVALGPPGADGRPTLVPVRDSGFELPVDCVFTALGFDPVPFSHWEQWRELKVNGWGGLVVDAQGMTTVRGVFAAGDLVQGPGLVVDVVQAARKAAEGIDRFLAPERLGG